MERGEKKERDGKCCLCRDAFVICVSGEPPVWGRAGFVSACENWDLGMFFSPYVKIVP